MTRMNGFVPPCCFIDLRSTVRHCEVPPDSVLLQYGLTTNCQSDKWVETAANGGTSTVDSLIEPYLRPICAFANSMVGDRATSEVVAQEVFLAAWSGLSGASGQGFGSVANAWFRR